MDILECVKKKIIEEKIVEEKDQVVIGCSGGPDSMFLLLVFEQLKEILNIDLVVAHVNHGVRGDLAKADQLFVERYCMDHHLPFRLLETNMNEKAKEWKLTPEEAGRKLRYDFFFSIAGKTGKVATAHHLDDQAETVLMRLIRGTGPDGMGAMEVVKGKVIRPLLETHHRDMVRYLDEKGIDYCIDHTNLETDYTRNYVRKKILPFMKEINPKVKEALVRYSFLEQEDRAYFEEQVENWIEKNVTPVEDGLVFYPSILSLPDALTFRILRRMVEIVRGTGKDFTYHHSKILKEGLTLSSGKVLDFPHGVRLSSEFGAFRLYRQREKRTDEISLHPGKNHTPWGIFVVEEVESLTKGSKEDVVFSQELPLEKVILRCRRPGDWMIPWGKTSATKVKDVFQMEKIPKSQRDHIPFLVYDKKVLWVVGVRRSSDFPYINGKGWRIKREVEDE